MKTVLMLTHRADGYVTDRVAEGLDRRGARGVRIDTEEVPAERALTVGLEGDGAVLHELAGVGVAELTAVWRRRMRVAPPPADLDPVLRAGIAGEVAAAWDAWLDGVAHLRVVNPPAAVAAVEGHKLAQLRAARAAGLSIPPTLVTNDPARVRAFCAAQGGDVVAKMLSPLTVSMDGASPFVLTRRVSSEDLEHLDELAVAPMCFQRRVPSDHELRVAWVDGATFVGRMGGGDDPDWRRGDRGGWAEGVLDGGTAAALDRLMRGLGLVYGAIDLIVPPGGAPVFLEVNPDGEWGMLERDLGLPVGDAIAAALLR